MEKIAIFVDVQNIYYTTREKYRAHFDYNHFWHVVATEKEVVVANAYAIASKHEKQRQFHHILRGVGFEVKLKPFLQRKDGSAKGDWDIGIALDIYDISKEVDRVILLSGDGDFDVLVDRVKKVTNTKFDVFGVPGLTSQSLVDACDNFTPIDDTFLLF